MKTNMSESKMFFVLSHMPHRNSMSLQTEDVSEKEARMWHCQFGHLNHKGLRTLACKKMVTGLPVLKSPKELCTTFLTGKQHRDTIPRRSLWKTSKQLQLVHSDICGHIKPASHRGNRYILSFINDYSRKTWIYFLHEKSEAFITVKFF